MTDHARGEHLEPGGVSTRRVTLAAAGFVTLLAGSIVVLGVIFYAVVPGKRVPTFEQFPRPRQEAHPSVELRALLARQRKEMSGYRWADANHTLVAIPIERAMQIIAARGRQAFAPIEPASAGSVPP